MSNGQKVLVVFFSKSGHTRQVGEAIAKQMGADVEELREVKKRSGIMGFLTSGRDAMKGLLTEIAPLQHRPGDYDLVVVGTPIYASTVSSPVRTFLTEQSSGLKKVAFYYTGGNPVNDKAFPHMAEASTKQPAATLGLGAKDVQAGAIDGPVAAFCRKLGC